MHKTITTLLIMGVVCTLFISTPSANAPQLQNTTTIDEKELHNEFNRIASLPYNEYQCRQKSDMLWDYIHKHDPNGKVYTVSIEHESKQYMHVYVLYNGNVYDPTCTPALYNQTMPKYQRNLDSWGFTGYMWMLGVN